MAYKLNVQLFIQEFYQAKRNAEENRILEITSALKIQSVFRQYKIRKRFWEQKIASIQIQRVYRGYLHGKRVKRQRQIEILQHERDCFYHHCATVIQKLFRAYFVRTYVYNWKKRRQELEFIERKNLETQQYIEQKHQELVQLAEQERQDAAWKEFNQVTQHLHHLVSTKCVPGIYKSPFQYQAEETVFDHVKNIEDFLRTRKRKKNNQSFKNSKYINSQQPFSQQSHTLQLNTQQSNIQHPFQQPNIQQPYQSKSSQQHSLHQSLHQSLHHSLYEPSVARSSPYGEEVVLERTERYLDKKMRIQKPISNKLDTKPHTPTLRIQSPYTAPQHQVTRIKLEPVTSLPFLPVMKAKQQVFDKTTAPAPCALPQLVNTKVY